MCTAPLSMSDVFLLGSIAMLVIVLMVEAFAYRYRRQAKAEAYY